MLIMIWGRCSGREQEEREKERERLGHRGMARHVTKR